MRLAFDNLDAVNDLEKEKLNLSVFPNPANDYSIVSLELATSETISYTMYDVNGKVVYTNNLGVQPIGMNRLEINTNNYESGIYYLILNVGNTTVSEKIVITK